MIDTVQESAAPYPAASISVEQYHRMIESGTVCEEDGLELLEGRLVKKMSRNPPHDGTLHRMLKVLLKLLTAPFDIRIQSALTTIDSEPEPDLAIVKADAGGFLKRHPEPRDIEVVIEIANTSLKRDRLEKTRVYARAGVKCYWLVNLIASRIEVYEDPDASGEPCYRRQTTYETNQAIPLVLDGQVIASIPVRDLLP